MSLGSVTDVKVVDCEKIASVYIDPTVLKTDSLYIHVINNY